MDKLILSCGRFEPRIGEDVEARERALEAYLFEMSGEMEFLMDRRGRLQESVLEAVQKEE